MQPPRSEPPDVFAEVLALLTPERLLHDPRAIFKFEENEVVLPIYVIEEIDTFKRDMNELGRNARMLARFIEVRGAHIHDPVAQRHVQGLCTGKEPD